MFLPPCSSNLSLNLPWPRNFTGKNLDLKPLKPTWPQLLCTHQGRHQGLPTPLQHLTSTVSSASKTRPSQGHQCLSNSEPSCKGKTLTPASKEEESCKQLYNNRHSCHLKSYCQKTFQSKKVNIIHTPVNLQQINNSDPTSGQ